MLNKAMLIGNVGKDPEIRTMQNGGKVCNLSLATSETWKDKSGEKHEKTEWHRVTIFDDKLVELAEKYIRKGSRLYLEGSIQTRKYADKDGVERYATEIVLQKFRGEIRLLGDGKREESGLTKSDGSPIMNDEIPF